MAKAPQSLICADADFADHFWTVVAREDDDGVLRHAILVESAKDLANHRIGLRHEVAVVAGLRFALELLRRNHGVMWRGQRHIEKEWRSRRTRGGIFDVFDTAA